MSFNKVTATGYIDLLNQVRDIAINESIATVGIGANDGAGYSIGDIVSLDGGTFTETATFEVTAVSSGNVTGIRRDNDGAYSVPTGLTDIETTMVSGTGDGALQVDVTYIDNAWVIERETQEAVSATVSAAGTGYGIGENLTVQDGDGVDIVTSPVFSVATVSSGPPGPVATVTLNTGSEGSLDETPTNPATTITDGTGDDACTLTVTYQAMSKTGTQTGPEEKTLILKGEGGGSDEIYVGFRTYLDGTPGVTNWEIAGFTGHTSGLIWANQPGISNGRHDVPSNGSYLAIGDSASPEGSIDAWIWCDTNHIKVVVKNGSTYNGMFAGWLDRFGTAAEFPYPLYICGSTSERDTKFNESQRNCNLADPFAHVNADNGPGQIHIPSVGFRKVANKNLTSGNSPFIADEDDYVVAPAGGNDVTGAGAPVPEEDLWFDTSFRFEDIVPSAGAGAGVVVNYKIVPTPETGEDLLSLFPSTLIGQSPAFDIQGQIPGVFWCSGASASLSAEDIIRQDNDLDGDWYIVFQNGTFTEDHMKLAIKKE